MNDHLEAQNAKSAGKNSLQKSTSKPETGGICFFFQKNKQMKRKSAVNMAKQQDVCLYSR